MLHAQLAKILGPKGWIPGARAAQWQRDWLDRYGEMPLGVARPASTAEVCNVMAAAHAAGVAVVPQGGNTGLCGGSVLGQPGGVILSMSRMAAISAPDLQGGTIEVEAGVVLAKLHAALDGTGSMFPLHLGAEGSAQIGGLIATNAGGSHAFRYGMMADLVLGLEVVLADGTLWNGMRAVQKDNTGYALKRLFCGSEGTLGVVTRATLRLSTAPCERVTALLALPGAPEMVAFGALLRADAGEFLTGMEFFNNMGLDFALRNIEGMSFPLETHAPFYLLVEAACCSSLVPLEDILGAVLEKGVASGLVTDGALAASEAQRAAFWRLREEQPEGQRLEGAQLKHDIAVPTMLISTFLVEGQALCQQILPGLRINPFGHLADGNIHYNLSPPLGQSDFSGKAADITLSLAQLATRLGGSFAAEHGLGRAKIALADQIRSPAERGLMAAIKSGLDPGSTLNPGVVVKQISKNSLSIQSKY